MSLAPSFQPAWHVGDSLQRVVDVVLQQGIRHRQQPDGSWMISCVQPGHPDRTPTLHVSHERTEHGGRSLFYCPACGPGIQQEDWAQLLGLELDDLFDDRRWSLHHYPDGKPRRKAPDGAPSSFRGRTTGATYSRLGPIPGRIAHLVEELTGGPKWVKPAEPVHHFVHVETYEYADENGVADHQVRRMRCTDEGCTTKTFPQRYLRPGRPGDREESWADSAPPGFKARLYRAGAVAAAIAEGKEIWSPEGEKDVHAAEALGLVACTNAGGGSSFREELAAGFAGAHLNVPMDRDRTGFQRGVDIHRHATTHGAASVRLWLPAVTKDKADLSDHLAAGYSIADLIEVPVEAAQAWALLTGPVTAAVESIKAAEVEIEAQLTVAKHDRAHGRKTAAQNRERYAARWTKEAPRAHAKLVDATRKIARLAAAAPQSGWAAEAYDIARSQLRAATSMARATFAQVAESVPPELEESTHAANLIANQPTHDPDQDVDTSDPAQDGQDSLRRRLALVPDRDDDESGSGGGGGGRGGGSDGEGHHHIGRDHFAIIDGEVVQITWEPKGDGTLKRKLKRLINAAIQVVSQEHAESDEDLEHDRVDIEELGDREGRAKATAQNEEKKTHVVLSMPSAHGSPSLVRVPADDFERGVFLSNLPIVHLDYARSIAGRAKVVQAISTKDVSPNTVRQTSYRATGWRTRADGTSMYVMSSGAIDANGYVPLATNLTGPLARFDLPNPTRDAGRLRKAFLEDAAGLLDRFEDRLGAVLVGTAFRASLCPNEWTTVLCAPPGVGKTGVASLTMHFYGELWDRMRPLTSLSGNGATQNALRIYAHAAKDALMFLDDAAPTAGYEKAVRGLEEIARMLHNQEARPRSERDGQSVLPGSRPRSSGLITSEVHPRAGTGGGRRLFLVPLSRHDVDVDDIRALDTMASRHGRAMLMASFLSNVAGDHRGALLRTKHVRDEFRSWLKDQPGNAQSLRDHGDAASELWAGWVLLLEFLAEAKALSGDEVEQWKTRIRTALHIATLSADDPDLVQSTGERACELLRFALSNGIAYVSDIHTGGVPDQMAGPLGWKAAPTQLRGGEITGGEWRPEQRALHLGYLNLNPVNADDLEAELVCDKATFQAVLKAAAGQMPDTTTLDLNTALKALEDDGTLKTKVEQGTPRRTINRTIHCMPGASGRPVRERRVVLRLNSVFADDDTPEDLDPADGPGQPTPPSPLGEPPAGGGTPPAAAPQAAASTTDQSTDPPMPQEQKATMSEHRNTAGLTLTRIQHADTQPCVKCGVRCGVELAGLPLHSSCFWATTAATVAELHAEVGAAAAAPDTAGPSAGVEPGHEVGHPRSAEDAHPVTPAAVAAMAWAAAGSAFTAAAAVVDVDAVWLPDGTSRPLPFPIEHLGHLEQLGRHLHLGHPSPVEWRDRPEVGMVVPTTAMWQHLGVPVTDIPARDDKRKQWFLDVSKDLRALTAAVDDGWVFGLSGDSVPLLRGITRPRRHGATAGEIAIIFTPGMDATWGLGADLPPVAIARRLQLFADAVGLPFRASPISTGLDLLKLLLPRNVRDALKEPVDWSDIPPARHPELELHFDWTRKPSPEEASRRYLMLFDRNGSYVATWGSLDLGIGRPEHINGPITFDPQRVGWWRITIPADTVDGVRQKPPHPDLLDPNGQHAGTQRWVTTPVLKYARASLHIEVEVHEAWLWPKGRTTRVLDPLYKRLRDARLKLADPDDPDQVAAQNLVKLIYKHLSGHFTSSSAAGTGYHQPYWFHAMRGQARVAILSNIFATVNAAGGAWPLVVSNNDALGYAVDTLDPVVAWPGAPGKLNNKLGSYKPYRWAPMDEATKFLSNDHNGWSGLKETRKYGEDE